MIKIFSILRSSLKVWSILTAFIVWKLSSYFILIALLHTKHQDHQEELGNISLISYKVKYSLRKKKYIYIYIFILLCIIVLLSFIEINVFLCIAPIWSQNITGFIPLISWWLWWFSLCLTLATPQTVACQTFLYMGFPRQEYWSGLPFPFSRGSCWPKDWTQDPCITGEFFTFTNWARREDRLLLQ